MIDTLDDPQVYLPDLFATHARHYPRKNAVICGDQTRSWGTFVKNINRVANHLIKTGLRKGDTIAVMMGNGIEMLECLFGVVRAGGCVVPLSGLLTEDQLENLLSDCDAVAAFVSHDFQERAENLQPRLPMIATWIAQGFDVEGWGNVANIYETAPDTVPHVHHELHDTFNIIY